MLTILIIILFIRLDIDLFLAAGPVLELHHVILVLVRPSGRLQTKRSDQALRSREGRWGVLRRSEAWRLLESARKHELISLLDRCPD